MQFDPAAVSEMAHKMHPAVLAARAHAQRIADVGFDPSHTGAGYQAEGDKLATGIDDLVAMLHALADTSASTVDRFHDTAAMLTGTDDHTSEQLSQAGGGSQGQ